MSLRTQTSFGEVGGRTAASTTRLAVCIIAPSLDIIGGQAVQARLLQSRLRDASDLELGFLPVNPRLPHPVRWLQRIKFVRTLVTSIAYVTLLFARAWRYDVLHVFSASYLSFVLAPTPAILIGRLFGKRVVLNYRSGQADDHLRRWRTAVPTIRLATRVVVPSGYLADVFVRYGIAARVVSNFVQPERFPFRVRERFRPIFLANRNFEAHYNVACILRAFRRIQRRYPEARLLLAGDGPERADLERLRSNLGLRDVRFLGPVAPERMPALYGEADIYLNAPNIDNMPVSVLEAYAAGLPVVTTDAGGIPYIVRDGETGLLVPRDDDRALADAAIRVIEDPDLGRRLVRNAHRECQAKYVWSAVRDEWRSLYREIVEHDG